MTGAAAPRPFWEAPLASLDAGQWEALCDGCGKCCLHKIEDEDTGRIYPTNVACRLLNLTTARCGDYKHRRRHVPDCLTLTKAKVADIEWLPQSCAYRLRAEGRAACPHGIIWCAAIAMRFTARVSRSPAGRSARISPGRWKIILSNAWFNSRAEAPHIQVGDDAWPVRVVQHAQSRRYRLVFDAARGQLRLTVPRRTNVRAALKWASEQQEWLAEQVGKAALPVIVGPGASVPFRGIDRRIDWEPDGAARDRG